VLGVIGQSIGLCMPLVQVIKRVLYPLTC